VLGLKRAVVAVSSLPVFLGAHSTAGFYLSAERNDGVPPPPALGPARMSWVHELTRPRRSAPPSSRWGGLGGDLVTVEWSARGAATPP